MKNDDWVYEETTVGQIRNILNEYEIEVDSPDGWVEVTDFVDKGMHEEHILETEDGDIVRCSDYHFFETDKGWRIAKDLVGKTEIKVLCADGLYKKAKCIKNTGTFIPIVDITVNHENHRYYTNGVSSHNTGGGKSLVKCHMAANHLMYGKNVVYITMEMAEERIAERIDANILDVSLDELSIMPRDVYEKKIQRYRGKSTGKLVVKEYPTGSAHVGHFRHLLNELKMKKGFSPDVIYIDYLNICASSRVKGASAANSYTLVKSIAEEVRGLAMEFNCAVVTSSQFNRDGYGNTDVDLTNTSECIFVKEKVKKDTGEEVEIQSLKPGDRIESDDGTKLVTMVHHPKKKNCIRIKTKSGKTILVSKDHVFPVKDKQGNVKRISFNQGLRDGMFLNSK